jgi:predicted enzyme related to lactoylglutathione lyase
MKRVTGIGGVFFKSEDPAKLKAWYERHLGIKDGFTWLDPDDRESKVAAHTAWGVFENNSDYFLPSNRSYMFNYRVAHLESLLKVLRDEGVTLIGEVETYSYGKFAWVMDPDGNKIELWEPRDDGF